MARYRQVVWNFPKEMYEDLEKAKAEGQQYAGVPASCSTESYVLFALDRFLKIYRKEILPPPVIVSPYDEAPLPGYKGTRT